MLKNKLFLALAAKFCIVRWYYGEHLCKSYEFGQVVYDMSFKDIYILTLIAILLSGVKQFLQLW